VATGAVMIVVTRRSLTASALRAASTSVHGETDQSGCALVEITPRSSGLISTSDELGYSPPFFTTTTSLCSESV